MDRQTLMSKVFAIHANQAQLFGQLKIFSHHSFD